MARPRVALGCGSTAATVAALLTVAAGCGWFSKPATGLNPLPTDWKGQATVDPAGDLAKLQGRWDLPLKDEGPNRTLGHWVVFDGDTATYHTLQAGKPAVVRTFRFVLNSALDPKVIRPTDVLRFEPQELADGGVPQAEWYRLDGATLTFWGTRWVATGTGKSMYRRSKGKE